MVLSYRNLYHPFLESDFGFFVQKGEFQEEFYEGFVVEEIDLYYQPLPDPVIGISFHVFRIILVGIGEFIHIKIWKLLNEENGLVKQVTKVYTITVMIVSPFMSLFNASIDFIHPLSEVIGEWYCTFGRLFMYLCWNIVSFHSFFVALMKYLFIVHEEKVDIYGKEKVKKGFLFLSFLVPLIVVTWGAIENEELDAMSFINKCYGRDHKVFLVDTSTLNVAGRNFCGYENIDNNQTLTEWFSSLLLQLSCIARVGISLFMGFNLFEGLLYFKILSHIYRYYQ